MRGLAENDGYNALVMISRPAMARRGAGARHLALPASDSRALFAGLHVDDAAQACGAGGEDRRSVPRAVRSAAFVARQAAGGRCRRNREGARSGRGARRGPHRPPLRQRGAVGDPHQFLSAWRRRPARSSRSRSSTRAASSTACRGRQPLYEIFVYSPRVEGVHLRFGKVARGGIRWSDRRAGFPHRSAGAGEGTAGQECRDRAGRLEGRLVPKHLPVGGPREAIQAEGTAAYRIFISTLLEITDNLDLKAVLAAGERGAARRRRSLSRGRRRQGHGDVLRHRQRHFRGAQVLARRCLRLRRLGRLRPQGHGHHRARGVGSGEAAFPRDGRRHIQNAVHRGRRRRHVGRRVRQWHAARKDHQASRGL